MEERYPKRGNILLRKKQYMIFDDTKKRLSVVKNILLGKGLNEMSVLQYFSHDSKTQESGYSEAIRTIKDMLARINGSKTIDECRGYEGVMSKTYFTCIDDAIKTKDTNMYFRHRSKRPPENNFNAVLSFLYTMLNLNCVSALETFGLDSYLGYLHEMRPGRESLANDLLEEMRAPFVDRFAVSIVNLGQIQSKDFVIKDGEIRMTDEARKKLLQLWEEERNKNVKYPFSGKSVPTKLVPYLQAQLLSQFIRGDIEEYPPFYYEWR